MLSSQPPGESGVPATEKRRIYEARHESMCWLLGLLVDAKRGSGLAVGNGNEQPSVETKRVGAILAWGTLYRVVRHARKNVPDHLVNADIINLVGLNEL